MFRDELGVKNMKEFCAPRAKTYTYLMDDDSEKKKAKGTRKCIIKRRIVFKDYKDSLFNNNIILRHNKIAISSNDDKRSQTFNRVTTYPYGTNAFKVCESEMMTMKKYA